MWLWEIELQGLGLRLRGERFRVCERRHGLAGHDHITVFSWAEELLPDGRIRAELTEFHVTLYRAGEALHFYYHEVDHNVWRRGGHTSRVKIAQLGLSRRSLRTEAERIACRFVEALGGRWVGQ
jgi:hypothetical protein